MTDLIDIEGDIGEGRFTCWCGAELSDDDLLTMLDELPPTCGGTGTMHCHCGGDQCVCHNHGAVQCDGCEDCDREREDDYYEPEE